MQAILALEDGRIFRGHGYGSPGECQGEVVFNTSLTGYQEIATDPSYAGQIVVLTNPQIGNYGTNQADNESAKPYIEGLIVREFSPISSNWRSEQVTDEYMERYSVPVLAEIDTRALVRHLRTHGVMRGVISTTYPTPTRWSPRPRHPQDGRHGPGARGLDQGQSTPSTKTPQPDRRPSCFGRCRTGCGRRVPQADFM
jgi:carbamoyl-phosphate synthase small subunit